MRKSTLWWLFILGIILAAVGGALYYPTMQTMMSATSSGTTVAAPGMTFFLGLGLSAIGSILSLIAWIGALVAVARQSRWVWFVVVLILNGLGLLIYLIFGPGLKRQG